MKKISSMYINVFGVSIELTPEQIAQVEAHRSYLRQAKLTFLQVLRKYGFKKLKLGTGYIHPKMDWWAEVDVHHNQTICFIAGAGIPKLSVPEPKSVDDPKDLIQLLNNALADPDTWEINYKTKH